MMPARSVFAALLALLVAASPAAAVQESAPADSEAVTRAVDLVAGRDREIIDAIDYFIKRGNPDGAFALVQAMRFHRGLRPALGVALTSITGADHGDSWFDWMEWLQVQDGLEPFTGFDVARGRVLAEIDPAFEGFIHGGVRHDIPLWEAVWGGVLKDGIPALTNPDFIDAGDADYLTEEDLVFGVKINGDARAYPLRIMDWHEMANDIVGGVPVSLAYCTLCGSGILFETTLQAHAEPLTFGSSGLLYRSNKLMYDHGTDSLWNQFTGMPVVGPLTGSGIKLKTRPVAITSWENWRTRNPDTHVLSLDTGHTRDYTPGAPYADYFSNPELIFPAPVDTTSLQAKDFVFALRGGSTDKAWPLSAFKGGAVVNDVAGVVSVTLIGDAATRTVRAYRTDGTLFSLAADEGTVLSGPDVWTVTEAALEGPGGTEFHRLPGHIAYWFAWDGYLGNGGDLASAERVTDPAAQ